MGTKFAHAALTVSSTERCLEFYRDLLGCTVSKDFGVQPAEMKTGIEGTKMRVLLLADATGHEVLETFEFMDIEQRRPGEKAHHTDYWVPHIALTVKNLKEVYDKLVEAGVEVSIPYVEAGGYKFTYVYDYDGFLVELIDEDTY